MLVLLGPCEGEEAQPCPGCQAQCPGARPSLLDSLLPLRASLYVRTGRVGQQLPLISPAAGLTGDQRWELRDSWDRARTQPGQVHGREGER